MDGLDSRKLKQFRHGRKFRSAREQIIIIITKRRRLRGTIIISDGFQLGFPGEREKKQCI